VQVPVPAPPIIVPQPATSGGGTITPGPING